MSRSLIGLTSATPRTAGGRSLWYGARQTYVRAIEAAGGVVVLIPPQPDTDQIASLLDRIDGLIIPGGEDVGPANYAEAPHPQLGRIDTQRDRAEIALVRGALDCRLPLLGICRGMQVINVALGGTLYQDLAEQLPGALRHDRKDAPRARLAHAITIDPGSRLAVALGTTTQQVNSLHHQAIRAPGRGVTIVARATDGVPEGIEIDHQPCALAVQYHPEELVATDPASARLFATLVEAAHRYRLAPQPLARGA